MEADETDDVAVRWVGLPLVQLQHDPRRGTPILVRPSWPAVTSSPKESLVAVERGHDSGSMMVMG
jgi:hypothetical protein